MNQSSRNLLLSAITCAAIVACNGGSSPSSAPAQSGATMNLVFQSHPHTNVALGAAKVTSALESAICQDSNCTWNNSASRNIESGETDAAFCTGTNTAQGGTGFILESGAYNMTLPTGIAAAKTGAGNTNVILELFNTPYANITPAMLDNYKAMGYTTIWVSPPQYSAAVYYSGSVPLPIPGESVPAWYGAYQPMDFGQIGNTNNKLSYGNAADLSTLITNAHGKGLQLIIDVAIHQFAQPGVNNTNYYTNYPDQTYSYNSGNIAAIQTFWWPQTQESGYIPFGNTINTCASFSSNVNHLIALWGNNPNGSTYSSSVSSSSMWYADFAPTEDWFGTPPILPAATNSSGLPSGVTTSCGTQSVFDGYSAWLLGLNYSTGDSGSASNAVTGFDADGFRIDDVSGQNPAFFTQMFKDIESYNHGSNIFFGEYPTPSASDYSSYISISVAPGSTASNSTMAMLNFPLLASMNSAFGLGGDLQSTLVNTITSSNAFQGNGTLPGVNAINMVMDQDTVPDSILSRAMCPWYAPSNEFTMNYYNAPLAYGVIMAIEAGTPFVYADLQAESGVGMDSAGNMVATDSNGSVSYWNENEVIGGVYFHNQTLNMSMNWANVTTDNGDNAAALTRGNNYFFIVNKSASNYVASTSATSTTLSTGCYIDLMSHEIVNITGSGNNVINNLIVPAQSVMYFVPYNGAVPTNAGFTCS